jgi:hypothetical protein
MPRFNSKARAAGLKYGWRSGLEEAVGEQLRALGIKAAFEKIKIPFTQPEKPRHYTPDWVLPNGIIIETKGRFVTADRQKHLLVQAQHPDLDIRFVFSNSQTRISKQSKTTYAAWASTKGFMYADKLVPPAWLNEPKNSTSLAAIAKLRNP